MPGRPREGRPGAVTFAFSPPVASVRRSVEGPPSMTSPSQPPPDPPAKPAARLGRAVLGDPKDPLSPTIFHQLSLMAFLAWVGLGADGLSSSCYGPEEAYPRARRRAVPGALPGACHRHHRAGHLGELHADHRAVPDRRRRLFGGDQAARPDPRRRLRLRAGRSTTCSRSPSRSPAAPTRSSACCRPACTGGSSRRRCWR